MQETDTVNTNNTSVVCYGKEEPFDHPAVYLEIDPLKREINCPYCSKKFILTI
jgi:uncharacterized Zn-finger protein